MVCSPRKGQAAFEYLVTYGWALLAVLVTLGALAYFGVISPSRWLPDKCDLGAQLVCEDYEVRAATGTISLYVRNDFGVPIEVTRASVPSPLGDVGSLSPAPVTINAGEKATLDIAGLGDLPVEGEKQEFLLQLSFKRAVAGAPEHQLAGVLYTTVRP